MCLYFYFYKSKCLLLWIPILLIFFKGDFHIVGNLKFQTSPPNLKQLQERISKLCLGSRICSRVWWKESVTREEPEGLMEPRYFILFLSLAIVLVCQLWRKLQMLIRDKFLNSEVLKEKPEYSPESAGSNLSQWLNWKSQTAFKRNLAFNGATGGGNKNKE